MGMAAILGIWPGPIEQTFVSPSHRSSIWNLTLIGPVFSEEKMFKECGRRRRPTCRISLPASLRLRGAKNESWRQIIRIDRVLSGTSILHEGHRQSCAKLEPTLHQVRVSNPIQTWIWKKIIHKSWANLPFKRKLSFVTLHRLLCFLFVRLKTDTDHAMAIWAEVSEPHSGHLSGSFRTPLWTFERIYGGHFSVFIAIPCIGKLELIYLLSGHKWFKFQCLTFFSMSSGFRPSRWKGNDREPIQLNSISCPRHQTGKVHKQLRRHKVKQHKRKDKRTAVSQQMATRLS